MRTHVRHLAVFSLALAAILPVASAEAASSGALPLDIKPLALETYGLRGAVVVNSNTVVAVLGAATLGSYTDPSVWRIRSEDDPAYAYELFVKPKAAKKILSDTEFPFPPKFDAPNVGKTKMLRHVVALTLPFPLKKGVGYGLVLHGSGAPTTGGKSGCFFSWDGTTLDDLEKARVPADDIAPRMVGLRRASPLGDGKIALEFGATFSTRGGRNMDNYHITVNGNPIKVETYGRRSKIDMYYPAFWPYRVVMENEVYLDLRQELKKGDVVKVTVDEAVCSGEREASFTFDPSVTVSRSIQANQIGYLPDGPKVAYLGFWLGSFPETTKKAEVFDYSTPPTVEEAYHIEPPEEVVEAVVDEAAEAARTNLTAATYDDLAPYAIRFHKAPEFELVREKDGKTVHSGVARLTHNGLLLDGRVNHSAENVYVLDFSDFAEPGRYYLRVGGAGRSIAFDIADDVYVRPFQVQSSGVFAQRCGIELTMDRAPHWHRIACHTNGVQLSTVQMWNRSGFGAFRENPVPMPNPEYPRIVAAQKKLVEDKALVARFPLEGEFANAIAGSRIELAPTANGCTFVDDEAMGAKVLCTGRKDNGLAGEFAIDPATGVTATFWMLREDVDGNNYGGPILRFGGEKGANLVFTAGWGVLKFGGGGGWKRVGDKKWRLYALSVSPAGEDGKMDAVLTVDGETALKQKIKPPELPDLTFAGVTGDAAAGCRFRDLRLYLRALSAEELEMLATHPEPTIPTVIPLVGGHHDAGDYNPRCHIEVAQSLLDAYEHTPQKFFDGQLDIPEAGNGIPDVVDEALWSLKPWFALQDKDGGVRHGTESAGDPNFYQTVELDETGDFAFEKDSRASFIFAGAFAQASRVLASLGRKQDAEEYLSRARRAYKWAAGNVPEGLKSLGQYTDYRLTPCAYAAAELLHTTGEKAFLEDFRKYSPWGVYEEAPIREDRGGHYDATLAAYAFVRNPSAEKLDPVLYGRVRGAIIREAEYYIEGSDQMAYKFIRHPRAPISWGTGAYENYLPPVLSAWFMTGDSKYRDWIIRTCDNTLGANPLGLCWITGLGERRIRAPLHNSRYRPEGFVADGMQAEGPVGRGGGYNYNETAYPRHDNAMAVMHSFVDCHFAIGMDEGLVINQARSMAVFGLLIPDHK